MMRTTVIERKTNPTDLNDTSFWSSILYSFTVRLYDSCSLTVWYTSLILSTMASISLLSYSLGSALKSDSWVRQSYFDTMVEVEGHIFIYAIFVYDAKVVFAGNWSIAINLFHFICPFINDQRSAIVMVKWDVVLIIRGFDSEVERCWFGWIG